MAYVKFNATNLSSRIAALPLILAGPMLRKVTATSVTVWVALKRSSSVTLNVFDGTTELFSSTATPSKIGEHLYLLVITAAAPDGHGLARGTIYGYNLTFDVGDLAAPGVYSTDGGLSGLCYAPHTRPTFVIAPPSWRDLHFVHGSCRKIHAQGLDALPAAGAVITQAATNPAERAQFLFLTGDQIYADDVAPSVLFMLRDVGPTMLGRADTLPGIAAAVSLEPGQRATVARGTLLLSPEAEKCASHLFHFYEFCAMYLMAWSDVLWPKAADFPTYKDVYGVTGDASALSTYGIELGHVSDFLSTLPEVRRVLANIPCYMIFDDHEVSDDWYLSADWCGRVLGSDAGRQMIQNALCAYAIFQAWGNTPEQFEGASSPGGKLLLELAKGAGASSQLFDWFLNIPPKAQIFAPNIFPNPSPTLKTDLTQAIKPTLPKGPILRQQVAAAGAAPDWLTWHYTINGADYQLIVLDTRTRRAYPGPSGFFPPQLLSDAAWDAQVVNGAAPPVGTIPELTFVVSPAAPLAMPVVELFQEKRTRGAVLDNDVEGWTGQNRSFQLLLSKFATRAFGVQTAPPIRRRVVILSGDVHHSFAVRVSYWATKPYESGTTETQAVFALLTASAFKNQVDKLWDTIGLHDHGYEWYYNPKIQTRVSGLSANKRDWINYFGWENSTSARTKVGTFRPGSLFPTDWKLRGDTPSVPCVERALEKEGATDGKARLTTPPEWRYAVNYLDSSIIPAVPAAPIKATGKQSVATAHRQHRQYMLTQAAGMQIVGRNNMGEITFKFEDGNTQMTRIGQRLWWREPQTTAPAGRTFHIVSLEFDDPQYPDPMTRLEP